MKSNATCLEQYIKELPADRKKPVTKLRETVLKNIPKGFQEVMCYGMLGYVVPHKLYPEGYHWADDYISMTVWDTKEDADAYHSTGIYKKMVDRIKDLFSREGVLKVYPSESVMEPA